MLNTCISIYGSYVPLYRGDNNEIIDKKFYCNFQLTQRDVENTIDRETSGNFGKGLLTMGNQYYCAYIFLLGSVLPAFLLQFQFQNELK